MFKASSKSSASTHRSLPFLQQDCDIVLARRSGGSTSLGRHLTAIERSSNSALRERRKGEICAGKPYRKTPLQQGPGSAEGGGEGNGGGGGGMKGGFPDIVVVDPGWLETAHN